MIKNLIERLRLYPLFLKYPITKQFFKFCLIGLTNLLIDSAIYWFLTRTLSFYNLTARVFSFVVAVSWSFIINHRWTFRSNKNNLKIKYLKFFTANVVSMLLSLSLFYLGVNLFHLFDMLTIVLVAFLVAFFNFSLNKFWTFNPEFDKNIGES